MRQWAAHHPDIPQATTGDTPDGGPWRKGRHVARLVEQAPDGVLVVSDVDVWTTPAAIRAAVAAVQDGAAWAVPHGYVYRLTEQATATLLAAGTPPDLDRPDLIDAYDYEEIPQPGHLGGGIVVLPRQTALTVPMDPRFEGWGQEDDAWALALTTLAGRPWRGRAPLLHLYHPPQPRDTRRHGNRLGLALYRRYQAATGGTPVPMRNLIGEIPKAPR
jgi:hypothetical protein